MTKREIAIQQQEARLFEFMGLDFPYKPPKPLWNKHPDPNKILVLSDPHTPYQSKKVMDECLELHEDASRVIVPGDLWDVYSKSRFRKNKHQSFSEEVLCLFRFLEWLSTHWAKVYVMIGNHDDRPEKKIAQILGDNTELLILTESNLLKKLASYFENIEVVGTKINDTLSLTHVYQHGDIIFTHAERSQAQKSGLLSAISLQLHRWGKRFGLKPFRVICQGHNHVAMSQVMGDEVWYLLPTAANPDSVGFEYIYGTRMIGDPPVVGYTVFYQKDGVTDINRSRYYVMENA